MDYSHARVKARSFPNESRIRGRERRRAPVETWFTAVGYFPVDVRRASLRTRSAGYVLSDPRRVSSFLWPSAPVLDPMP